ncbi:MULTISPECIES: ABC transporter substrate-binding protein [Paenibacillus]|uniref:ABC transporter substrate-binding protein n=1 Tax=Paenibacillus TaxID=44249 RepID=UPI0004F91528|nr:MULTISPECIES: extracellular solute-binding protein [unclassified Paenibacillus]AIQ31222.1 sugar ABC transporter substrate-binding protein [Paenibacillus sp. FSL P4-0081]OMF27336.1 sugar ABC transporter substrate-binding protein [Paenibacillus sp. FSL H8-0259]
MKVQHKRLSALMITLSMALLLSACGGGNTASDNTPAADTAAEGGTVKIKVYAQHFDDDTKGPFDYAVEELKKEMPEVEIELDPAVQDGYQKLKTYAATGNMPDIYFTDWATLQTFAKSKNVELLDDYETTAEYKKNLNPGVESRLVAPDGHVYAYPDTGIEFQLIYYNKTIFDEVGIATPIKTIDELAAAAAKLNAAGYVPMSIFAKEKWISAAFYNGLVTREESQGFGALGEQGMTELSQPFVTAAEQLEQLQQAKLFDANATNTNYDQASSQFYQAKSAMFVNGQWEIYSAAEKLGDQVDWMYWPAKDEATYEASKYYIDGAGSPQGYAVSPASANKETAVKVAAFLAAKSAEYKYTQLGSPIISPKTDKPIASDVPVMMQRVANELLPNAKEYAKLLSNTQIQNAINDNAQNMLVDGFTTDQFVENLNRTLDKENK